MDEHAVVASGRAVAGQSVPLSPGVVATVSDGHDHVLLSIGDEMRTSFTMRIPSRAASDLAVALVNAANDM